MTLNKKISFCTPVKNRSSDLIETLPFNLEENRSLKDEIEFVVISYDENDDLLDKLRCTYPKEIAERYLIVHGDRRLPEWHFCRAKNGFRDRIAGAMYSSLDADNFLTRDETQLLLDILSREGENFVHHGFSGAWGDGTSGRVTLPTRIYERVGYDETFMPRQYDEIDLMLTALAQHQGLKLICYNAGDFISLSGITSGFLDSEGWNINAVKLERPQFRSPLNPRGNTYLKKDLSLELMLKHNQCLSFAKNTRDAGRRRDFLEGASRLEGELKQLSEQGYVSGPHDGRPSSCFAPNRKVRKSFRRRLSSAIRKCLGTRVA